MSRDESDRRGPENDSPLEGGASLEEQRAQRLAKVDRLRESGVDPYPVGPGRDHTCASLRTEFGDLEPGTETGRSVQIVGRMVLVRVQGKLTFATLRDATGEIQLFVSQGELGADRKGEFDDLDRGDWIWVSGEVMTTRRGELSVKVAEFSLLSKAIRPLPDKWHGLADVDTRFRQRELDLIANEDARKIFDVRLRAVQAIRRVLESRGFIEVETPVLQTSPGGAAAKPFVTHHAALGMDLYLRIAPELYLKRLIVGGYERVYELGRVFRNEGLSTRHNPEFTMLEAYQAFADYTSMMDLVEHLVSTAATEVLGTTEVDFGGHHLDLAPPWPRRPLLDLVKEHAGVDVHPSMSLDELRAICDGLDVEYESYWGPGKLVLEIYEKTTEAELVGPVFVLDYPLEVSPLARTHRDDPTLVERFEAIVGGRELANAFTELNDPVEQRRRFELQAELKALGDEEAQGVDEEYIRALEFGLPPCGGLGIGIDRLAMLLAGVTSIREVLFFPHLRPERPSGNDSPERPSGNDSPERPSGNDSPERPSGNDSPERPSGEDSS